MWTDPENGTTDGVQPLTSGLLAFTDLFKVGTLDTTTAGADTIVMPTMTTVFPTVNHGSFKFSAVRPATTQVHPASTVVTGAVSDGFTLWSIPTSPFAETVWIGQLPSGPMIFTEEVANKIGTLE